MAGTSKASSKMEWTEEHDLLLMREMIVSDLFQYKKGSPNRGIIWENIVVNLNKIEDPLFNLKDKRSIRDRWSLLKTKFKQKIREEEASSGIDVDELSEKESLIEELCEREESFVDVASIRKQQENANANDIRMTALERMGETSKRKSEEQDSDPKAKKKRRGSSELVEYLRERTSNEMELRRAELEVKRNEQEIQKTAHTQAATQQIEVVRIMQEQNQKMMESQALLIQQQQQISAALLAMAQRFTEK